MIAFLSSLRGIISSLLSLILTLEMEYCSGGDFVIIYISQFGIRERILNIKFVLPEKDGPTKSVRLLFLSTISSFGC